MNQALWPVLPLTLLLAVPLPHVSLQSCPSTCSSDADGDGVCDGEDLCPGFSDSADADADGLPDACDLCPSDPLNDPNLDGLCESTALVELSDFPRDSAVLQRDATGFVTLHPSGHTTVDGYSSVRLEVMRDGLPYSSAQSPIDASGRFGLTAHLEAGLHSYTLTLTLEDGLSTVVAVSRKDVVVGDLWLIQGQSNAVAADYHGEGLANTYMSPWIRSFGTASLDGPVVAADLAWYLADGQSVYSKGSVGSWALKTAFSLHLASSMPIGLLNGAVGGTNLLQHQRNDGNPEDLNTIYGRFLYRARLGGFTSGPKAMVWYQGESDGYGWGDDSNADLYLERFTSLHDDWSEDFPSVERLYVFQVRYGCGLDHPGDATLEADFYDAAGSLLTSARTDLWSAPEWSEYTAGLLEVPPAASRLVYSFSPIGLGPVTFDDASAMRAEGELLLNSSFEEGTVSPASWTWSGQGTVAWLSDNAVSGSRSVSLESASGTSLLAQEVTLRNTPYVTPTIYAASGFAGAYYDVRDALRHLPLTFPEITVMSTTAAPGHDGCHFFVAGYFELADRLTRLLLRDFYGGVADSAQDAPAPLKAVQLDESHLRVSFSHAGQGLRVDQGAEDHFKVAGATVIAAQTESADTLLLTLSQPSWPDSLAYSERMGDSPNITNSLGIGLISFADLWVSDE